jgi:hypothetical protein
MRDYSWSDVIVLINDGPVTFITIARIGQVLSLEFIGWIDADTSLIKHFKERV